MTCTAVSFFLFIVAGKTEGGVWQKRRRTVEVSGRRTVAGGSKSRGGAGGWLEIRKTAAVKATITSERRKAGQSPHFSSTLQYPSACRAGWTIKLRTLFGMQVEKKTCFAINSRHLSKWRTKISLQHMGGDGCFSGLNTVVLIATFCFLPFHFFQYFKYNQGYRCCLCSFQRLLRVCYGEVTMRRTQQSGTGPYSWQFRWHGGCGFFPGVYGNARKLAVPSFFSSKVTTPRASVALLSFLRKPPGDGSRAWYFIFKYQ